MIIIVAFLLWTSLGGISSQSLGLKLVKKSVVCANEAMVAARKMHSAIKNVDCDKKFVGTTWLPHDDHVRQTKNARCWGIKIGYGWASGNTKVLL